MPLREMRKIRNAGQIIPRGRNAWLLRIFLGRGLDGKRNYHNETVHGERNEAEERLQYLLEHRDMCRSKTKTIELDLGDVDDVFTRPCVYHLLDEYGNVVYVGLSRNWPTRISAHRKEGTKIFSKVKLFFPDSDVDLEQAEYRHIMEFSPIYNVRHKQ